MCFWFPDPFTGQSRKQTSQLSRCHRETRSFSCDLTVSQLRPNFSRSTVPEHDRLINTTGGLIDSWNAKNVPFWRLKRKMKAQECRIALLLTNNSRPPVGRGLKFQVDNWGPKIRERKGLVMLQPMSFHRGMPLLNRGAN